MLAMMTVIIYSVNTLIMIDIFKALTDAVARVAFPVELREASAPLSLSDQEQ